jgi:DUF971 family protein
VGARRVHFGYHYRFRPIHHDSIEVVVSCVFEVNRNMRKNTVRPTDIKLHQKSRLLEVAFDDGSQFKLPCEYLRVYSPSAEVRGHAPGQEILQLGKENVNITHIEPVGSYAVTLYFDDGHSTGIYSWDWLHHLGTNQESLWKQYLDRLAKAGYSRKLVKAAE